MAIAYFDPKIARGSRLWEVLEGAVSIYGRGLHFSAFYFLCTQNWAGPIMYTYATMACSIQLQTTLTDTCGVQKREKSIQTSNKNIS